EVGRPIEDEGAAERFEDDLDALFLVAAIRSERREQAPRFRAQRRRGELVRGPGVGHEEQLAEDIAMKGAVIDADEVEELELELVLLRRTQVTVFGGDEALVEAALFEQVAHTLTHVHGKPVRRHAGALAVTLDRVAQANELAPVKLPRGASGHIKMRPVDQ